MDEKKIWEEFEEWYTKTTVEPFEVLEPFDRVFKRDVYIGWRACAAHYEQRLSAKLVEFRSATELLQMVYDSFSGYLEGGKDDEVMRLIGEFLAKRAEEKGGV